MPSQVLPLLLALLPAAAAASSDAVHTLPTYGALKVPQFAGFVNATDDGKNQLHYWFAACSNPTPDTPLLIWLNGGPGASSLTGLLAEKLGPQSITANATLEDNPDTITNKYHLLTVDNPVGSGYSYTTNGGYVNSIEEVRTQFLHGLRIFYARHPEYAKNPLWVTGESYGGHYVPNVAYEIAVNGKEIPLQGVVIGNGMYNMKLQYPSCGEIAFGAGVIDETVAAQMATRAAACLKYIDSSPADAGDFCENATVKWLYSDAEGAAGELFYYDIGLLDADWFDDLTDAMGKYLNRADVKAAVHGSGSAQGWVQADETGPVAAALLPDWVVDSDVVVEKLLTMGLKVRMYNGVRDMSSCNHMGNLQVLLNMECGAACDSFKQAEAAPWPSAKLVHGHLRSSHGGKLQYATLLRTGHLVPTVVPEVFGQLLETFLA